MSIRAYHDTIKALIKEICLDRTYIKKYKLFSFMPILTEYRFNEKKTKWFLFAFIPLLKISGKENKK